MGTWMHPERSLLATAQCAAAVIVTAIVTPLVVNALYKYEEKHGLINYDVPLASEDTALEKEAEEEPKL